MYECLKIIIHYVKVDFSVRLAVCNLMKNFLLSYTNISLSHYFRYWQKLSYQMLFLQ